MDCCLLWEILYTLTVKDNQELLWRWVWLFTTRSQLFLGGSQQRCIRGSSAPGSNPLSFHIPFLAEEAPLSYTFYRQMVPLAGGAFPFRPLWGVPPRQHSYKICCEYQLPFFVI